MRRKVLIALVLLVPLVACGGGDDNDGKALEPCSSILAAGKTTPDLVHPPRCLGPDGSEQGLLGTSWSCKDGVRLFANGYGYGRKGDSWHTDAKDHDYAPTSPLGKAISVCEGRG